MDTAEREDQEEIENKLCDLADEVNETLSKQVRRNPPIEQVKKVFYKICMLLFIGIMNNCMLY